jgi:uncharacterized membrane protein
MEDANIVIETTRKKLLAFFCFIGFSMLGLVYGTAMSMGWGSIKLNWLISTTLLSVIGITYYYMRKK